MREQLDSAVVESEQRMGTLLVMGSLLVCVSSLLVWVACWCVHSAGNGKPAVVNGQPACVCAANESPVHDLVARCDWLLIHLFANVKYHCAMLGV